MKNSILFNKRALSVQINVEKEDSDEQVSNLEGKTENSFLLEKSAKERDQGP